MMSGEEVPGLEGGVELKARDSSHLRSDMYVHIIPVRTCIFFNIHKDLYVTCIFCTTMHNAGKLVHMYIKTCI